MLNGGTPHVRRRGVASGKRQGHHGGRGGVFRDPGAAETPGLVIVALPGLGCEWQVSGWWQGSVLQLDAVRVAVVGQPACLHLQRLKLAQKSIEPTVEVPARLSLEADLLSARRTKRRDAPAGSAGILLAEV